MISWEGRSCNGKSIENTTAGAAFYGEKGTVVIAGGNDYKIYDLKSQLVKEVTSDLKFIQGDIRNPSEKLDAFHFSNFLDAIRKSTPLNADINVGAISTTLALLGNISQRTKTTLQTNPRVKNYKDNVVHYNWHWFYDWGTGESGNNAVHFIDVLRWGMGVLYPNEVSSTGGRFCYKDDWQFPTHR